MTTKERLKKFIEHKQISVRFFESSVGLSHGYVNNIRVSIQPDKMEKIALRYPDLNTGWLYTGNGNMLNEESDLNLDSDMITMSREAFAVIKQQADSQSETILSQQRTIELMQRTIESMQRVIEEIGKNSKAVNAQEEESVECADVSGRVLGK